MRDQLSDETLMRRYAEGDAAAFEELYARYRKSLYGFLVRQCGNPQTAEELYQEIWLKLIRARERYEVRASFRTFLFRIAHNTLVDHLRALGRHPEQEALEYEEEDTDLSQGPAALANPDDELETRQLAEHLVELIGALPEVQREVFLLKEEAGMGIAEIAEVLGENAETVKSRLRYAWTKLRRGLAEHGT